jgi:hypothetical protein
VVNTVCVCVCVCMCTSPTCEVNVGTPQNTKINKQQHHLSTYQHCLSTMISAPPQIVFFYDCCECPEPIDLENTLEDVFIDNAIENITFKQWILTDRCEFVITESQLENSLYQCLKTCYFVTSSLQHNNLCSSEN